MKTAYTHRLIITRVDKQYLHHYLCYHYKW